MTDLVEQKKSRRGFWIAFIVVVPVISILCGVYSGYLYATRSTPQNTLSAFCSAVQSGDDLKAYSQYSNAYQHSYPRQQFESDLSADKVISCTYGAVRLSGNKVATGLKLIHASRATDAGTVSLSQDGNNVWKINNGVSLATPLETVKTFCDAIQHGDYKAAHNEFTASYQREYPEQQFESDLSADKVASCAHDAVAVSGASALTHLTLVHASKMINADTISLSQDGNNVWKINNGVNLSTPLEAVNTFCTAIQHGDYQMAYAQFASDFQKIVSQQDFVAAFSQANVTACTHDSPTVFGSDATAMLKLVSDSNSGYSEVVLLVQDASNGWKIERVQLQ